MKEKVENVIKEIRPALQADGGDIELVDVKDKPALQAVGGDIELVDVKDNVVKVRLKGACAGCPFSQMTMQNFVAEAIKKNVPSIKSVEVAD